MNKRNWHLEWQTVGDRRIHSSGLEFEYDEVLGWSTCDDTIALFEKTEKDRGVPLHDIQNRLKRLLKECSMWRDTNAQ